MLDYDTRARTEMCMYRNALAWGKKAERMCGVLVLGASNSCAQQYRPEQVAKVLDTFAGHTTAVCNIDQRLPIYAFGTLKTESGRTSVEFRFDGEGLMRVFRIIKEFADANEATNTAVTRQLLEKHPYASTPLNRHNDRNTALEGVAPTWGGTVKIEQRGSDAPSLWMTAKESDFDQWRLAVCKQVKSISVK